MISERYWLKLAKLKSEMLLKTQDYYEALKEDKPFEEVKKLGLELRRLEQEYQKLVDEKLPWNQSKTTLDTKLFSFYFVIVNFSHV